MDHRQRVLTALDHREPDRVPRGIGLAAEDKRRIPARLSRGAADCGSGDAGFVRCEDTRVSVTYSIEMEPPIGYSPQGRTDDAGKRILLVGRAPTRRPT